MAVCMIAAMVAAVLCAAVPADADNGGPEPRYIIGTGDGAYYAPAGEEVKGEFIFNSPAFDGIPLEFSITEPGKTWTSNNNYIFTRNVNETTTTTTISIVNNGVGHSVTVSSTAPSDVHATLEVTVGGTFNDNGSDIPIPEQTIAYGINVSFYGSAEIVLKKGSSKVVTSEDERYTFDFEKEYSISASIEGLSDDESKQYRYYATGLPSGISMTLSGNIAGILSKDCTDGVEKAEIYAVSEVGQIAHLSFYWKIGTKASFEGDFSIKRGNTNISDTGYDVGKESEILTYTIEVSDGYSIGSISVVTSTDSPTISKNGKNDEFSVTLGTGKLVVTVKATVSNDAYSKVVTKSFTVYAVGTLVDSDLDPSVTVKQTTSNP